MSHTASLLPATVRTRRGWEDPAQAARRIWWRVAIVLNLVLLPLLVIGRVTTAALIVLLIGVLARHDGAVRVAGARHGDLLDQTPPGLHCLWIGRDHRETIGADLVEQVLAGGHVTLVDTADGRPDLADLVSRHATAFDAVFVVSNGPVREQVAAACNRLGLPWYGPTFDS